MSSRVTVTAEDGVRIAGTYEASSAPRSFALLLHMMPATKESYATFQSKLLAVGISSLAIDFRGHGESAGGPDGYQRFSDALHQSKMKDIEAAVVWLESHGATKAAITIIGASIGANLALQYAAAHQDIPAAVALSPGLNYRGVLTMPAVQGLRRTQRLYLAASRDDAESDAAVEKLAEVSLAKTTVKHFEDAGHGTTLFERNPAFMDELLLWIKQ